MQLILLHCIRCYRYVCRYHFPKKHFIIYHNTSGEKKQMPTVLLYCKQLFYSLSNENWNKLTFFKNPCRNPHKSSLNLKSKVRMTAKASAGAGQNDGAGIVLPKHWLGCVRYGGCKGADCCRNAYRGLPQSLHFCPGATEQNFSSKVLLFFPSIYSILYISHFGGIAIYGAEP